MAEQSVPDSVRQAGRDAYIDAEGREGTSAALDAAIETAYVAGVAAGRAQAAADIRIMTDGFQALAKLDEHAYSAGIPFVPYGAQPESWCGPCSKFAAALLRGETPADAGHLRCPQAQTWQQQVGAAVGLVKSIEEAP